MPYVMGTSGLGQVETRIVPKNTTFNIPIGTSLKTLGVHVGERLARAVAAVDIVTTQAANGYLVDDAIVDRTTGKLLQGNRAGLSTVIVVKYGESYKSLQANTPIYLPNNFQLVASSAPHEEISQEPPKTFTSGGITYYRIWGDLNRRTTKPPVRTSLAALVPSYTGPSLTITYVASEDLTASERLLHGLPAVPAPTVRPPISLAVEPRSAKEIVKLVQDKVGVTADGKYGKKTDAKLKNWAEARNVSRATFDANGPRALKAHFTVLGLTSLAELEVLGTVWDAWKRHRLPVEPVAPLPSEVQERLTDEELARQGVVQRGGFIGWVQNYWWVLAVAAVAGIGYVVWKRRTTQPELPAAPEQPFLPPKVA